MNLVLTYCWKEWRAQRAVLSAYTGMGLFALCLVFLLVPQEWWLDDGKRALALSWFVVIGGVGVIAFATPALVRGEFGSKGDQFVRRLPGALRPAFAGKLLFLGLTAVALPLACLLVGEGFLLAIGQWWHDLFTWQHNGEVVLRWPWPVLWLGLSALLTTWVWAIGGWLPAGRMALGGTILFGLLLGLGVFAVLRQCPGIESGVEWQAWWWWPLPSGLAVAFVSWAIARRGGGPWRSARFGLAAAALVMAPPATWLGANAWRYHHPDLGTLERLQVCGTSPDGRFVLAEGNAHWNWSGVPLRIDLQTGRAEQLGGIDLSPSPNALRPHLMRMTAPQRYWVLSDWQHGRHELFDLTNGAREAIGFDAEASAFELAAGQHQRVLAEQRQRTRLRLPGDRAVWLDGGALWTADAQGAPRRVLDVERTGAIAPAGHAVQLYVRGARRVVDVRTGRTLLEDAVAPFLVRDVLLFVPRGKSIGQWSERREGVERECEPLRGCEVLGLVDDDRVLCVRTSGPRQGAPRLFVYAPANGATAEIALPADAGLYRVTALEPLHGWGSLLLRDPAGRVWLRCGGRTKTSTLRVDLERGEAVPVPGLGASGYADGEVIAWPDVDSVVWREGARILRIELATGARGQLFPRDEAVR